LEKLLKFLIGVVRDYTLHILYFKIKILIKRQGWVVSTFILYFKDGFEIFNDLLLSDSIFFYRDKNKVYGLFQIKY